MTLKHPRLAHALMHLRPGAKPLVDFICVNNGKGPELEEGSMVNPPTQVEVDAVTTAQLDAAQRAKAGTLRQRFARAGIDLDELKTELSMKLG